MRGFSSALVYVDLIKRKKKSIDSMNFNAVNQKISGVYLVQINRMFVSYISLAQCTAEVIQLLELTLTLCLLP